MGNHTPGPWEWDGKFTVCIPHAKGMTCFRTNPEDAALIVQAPAMWEKLLENQQDLTAMSDKLEKAENEVTLLKLERDRANQMLDGMTKLAAQRQGTAAPSGEGRVNRIIDSLKDAIAGDFPAVTIDGVRWVRQPLSPPGWVCVPREITGEMELAAWEARNEHGFNALSRAAEYGDRKNIQAFWSAMLAAAPKPEGGGK